MLKYFSIQINKKALAIWWAFEVVFAVISLTFKLELLSLVALIMVVNSLDIHFVILRVLNKKRFNLLTLIFHLPLSYLFLIGFIFIMPLKLLFGIVVGSYFLLRLLGKLYQNKEFKRSKNAISNEEN